MKAWRLLVHTEPWCLLVHTEASLSLSLLLSVLYLCFRGRPCGEGTKFNSRKEDVIGEDYLGRVVQVDPVPPMLKAPVTKRLIL